MARSWSRVARQMSRRERGQDDDADEAPPPGAALARGTRRTSGRRGTRRGMFAARPGRHLIYRPGSGSSGPLDLDRTARIRPGRASTLARSTSWAERRPSFASPTSLRPVAGPTAARSSSPLRRNSSVCDADIERLPRQNKETLDR